MSVRVLHVAKVAGISGAENHLLLLLPALRERGFDVRLVMLHEDEPGARTSRRGSSRRGSRSSALRLARAADPAAFTRLARIVRRQRPAILHTHLVHADFHGLAAGRLARVPVLVSTKHGFNPFRGGRAFAAADRAVSGLADVHIAISAGLARYLAESEGFDESSFEIVHYGIEPGPPPAPLARRAAARGRRPADPDQGPRRPAPGRGRRAERPSRAHARDRGRRAARAGAPGDRRAARAGRRRVVPRPGRSRCARSSSGPRSSSCRRSARASGWSRSRRWSAAGR